MFQLCLLNVVNIYFCCFASLEPSMIRLMGDVQPSARPSAPSRQNSWTQSDLDQALDKINKKELSVLKASNLYQIPRRTLRDYIKKKLPKKQTPGRKPVLSPEEEEKLKVRINRLSDIGFPVTPKVLRRTVYEYAVENKLEHRFNESRKTAGKMLVKLNTVILKT